MSKSQDILIGNFQKGIGESPYVGFGRIQNLDIWTYPGMIKIKRRQILSFTPVGLPVAMCQDTHGNTYIGTNQGYLYKNGSLVSGTPVTGADVIYDMKVWQDYLFITVDSGGQGQINVYGPLGNLNPLFTSGWQSTPLPGSVGYNKPIVPLTGGQTIYIGAGNNIATITSFVTGTPAVPPTGTINTTAIPLQYGEYCRTLKVLGRNLLIGTQGGSSFLDITSPAAIGIANIYPYDLETLTLGTAIPLSENGINQMWVQGNTCYIHAGIYGNIYQTNGSSVQFYKRIPINRSQGGSFFPYPNAIGYVNNELLSATSTGIQSSTDVNGIYSFRGNATNFKTISTGNVGASQNLYIGSILPQGPDSLLIGWQDGSTYGVDTVDANVYANFLPFFESEVFTVGEPSNTENFDDIMVFLAQPLTSTQQIRLSWRDGQGAYTPIKTLGSTMAATGFTGLFCKSLISNAITVQIKCELNQPAPSVFGSNISLIGIKLKRHLNG